MTTMSGTNGPVGVPVWPPRCELPARWDMLLGQLAPPPGMLAELDRLRAALPSYDVIVTRRTGTYRYEATRRHTDGPGLWCLISTDPADLWRDLAPPARAP